MIKFEASVEKKDNTVVNCYTTSMDELLEVGGNYENEYLRVLDHETGELLFRANHPTAEDYADEHFQLMCLGCSCPAATSSFSYLCNPTKKFIENLCTFTY